MNNFLLFKVRGATEKVGGGGATIEVTPKIDSREQGNMAWRNVLSGVVYASSSG